MYQTSNENNGNIVNLKLTIGQCKLIERLADVELSHVEAGISEYDENALKRLIDTFNALIQETPSEKAINDEIRAAKFEAWASKSRPQAVHHD